MDWFAIIVSVAVSLAIITIGLFYVVNPRAAAPSFGLPLPEEGRSTDWWLRLKGTRDIVSGLVLLAILACGSPRLVGIVLVLLAIIPLGDMTVILAAGGSRRRAVFIHGATAALMVAAAITAISAGI